MADTPTLRGERIAGLVLWRAGPAGAAAVLAVTLAAVVLAPLHLWRPVVALPVLLVLGAAGWRLVLRVPHRPAPVWAAGGTVLAALAFAVWTALTHGEHVVLRRDGGSYALFAQWLATRHGLPVEPSLSAFGGPAALDVPGLTFASPGFFETSGPGLVVVPQFLPGPPAVFSLGWWLTGGWTGLLVAPAVLGGLALLALGALTARTVGPRWAPLAVVTLGLAQPVVLAARTTFSETPALVLVLGAAALAVDAVERDRADLAWCAGALTGLAGLVRIDALREVVVLLPLCALLALRGSRAGVPAALGAIGGTLVAAVPAVLLSRPYLDLNRSSLLPLVALAVVVTLLSALAVVLGRRRGSARTGPVRGAAVVPRVCGAIVALTWVALAARPALGVARGPADDPGVPYVASLQRQQGLPADGARTYAEQSLNWVAWYTGWAAVVLAAATFTVLAVLAGRWWVARDGRLAPGWLLPAGVGLGSTVLTLYRPGITPDHPWADRRLVVTVLPAVVLTAVAAVAWAVRLARRRAPAPVLVITAVLGAALLVVPALAATLPLARSATERGEVRAVDSVCASLHPEDVVVALPNAEGESDRATNEWPQVVRGVCGVPAVSLFTQAADLPAALDRLSALAAGAGRRLVVLGADDAGAGDLHPDRSGPPPLMQQLGLAPTRVGEVATQEEPRSLTRPARRTVPLLVEVSTAPWPRS